MITNIFIIIQDQILYSNYLCCVIQAFQSYFKVDKWIFRFVQNSNFFSICANFENSFLYQIEISLMFWKPWRVYFSMQKLVLYYHTFSERYWRKSDQTSNLPKPKRQILWVNFLVKTDLIGSIVADIWYIIGNICEFSL